MKIIVTVIAVLAVLAVAGIVSFCKGSGFYRKSKCRQGDEKPAEETSDDSKNAKQPDETPLKVKPALCELHGSALWTWWTIQTGDWGAARNIIEEAAQKLSEAQAAELCDRYQADHPMLYEGICLYADWYNRCDAVAKVLGLRIRALLIRSGRL